MTELMKNPSSASGEKHLPDSAFPAAVRVLDGAVYLPEGKPVASDGPEFERLLRKYLPQEIAPDIVAQWRGETGKTTRLQWLISVSLLLAAAGFLYYFFPKTRLDAPRSMENMKIVNLSPRLRSNSPYRGDYERARESFKKGNYHDSARTLKSDVDNIIRAADRTADPVLILYFDSLMKIRDFDIGDSEAAAQLRVLQEYDPDNPAWAQFAFELNPRILSMRNYHQVSQNLRQPAYRKSLRSRLLDVDFALKQLRILRNLVNPAKLPEHELKQQREHFDLFEIQLRISRWLLVGSATGESSLPDNFGDPGVDDRETALRIAKKYEHSACEDFWRARRFIAEELCRQDSLFNHIYWNGQYLKTRELLVREMENCDRHLNSKEQL